MNDDGGEFAGLDRFEARAGDRRAAARDGRPRGGAAAPDGHRPLRSMRHGRRAAPVDPVVRAHQAARGARARQRSREGRTTHHPRALREGLRPLDGEHPRLGGRAAAVVGPSDPGLVLPGRPHHRVRRGGRTRRLRDVRPPGSGADPGDRHLRHLVQQRPVAVQHARLAGRHARPADASTRPRSWRPATTSSSSGSRG